MDILELGTTFDWISPTLAIAQDLTNGGGFTFLIDQACGWTGHEIAKLLHDEASTSRIPIGELKLRNVTQRPGRRPRLQPAEFRLGN